jgi:hypothetical protein
MRQRSTNTFRTPPETALPITTPPWLPFMVQPRITMFSEGTPRRRPSSLRSDLMAMQSSPVSKTQSSRPLRPSVKRSEPWSLLSRTLLGEGFRLATLDFGSGLGVD